MNDKKCSQIFKYTKPLRQIILGVMVFGVIVTSLNSTVWAESKTANNCEQLANLKIDNQAGESYTNLLSAKRVSSSDLPEYCQVLGYIRPAINFEIRLPTKNWNGKFYMAGCAGFCGKVDADKAHFFNAINYGLKRNYAVSTMDAGHWGSGPKDARWAYNNRQAEIDWSYRAVHETASVTKEIISAYYGDKPKRAYFQGCSTGGRMANMAAWRYPNDFDGIISGAPALNYTGLVGILFSWLMQANIGPDGQEMITYAKVEMIRKAVYKTCDAVDGLQDGLIDDPRQCDFKPASLLCQKNETSNCLSASEVDTLEKWYGGAKNSNGERLYPGIPLGSEPYWWLWLTGNKEGSGRFIPDLNLNFLRYIAFQHDPGENDPVTDFNFDHDPAKLAFMGNIYNSTAPDLSAFKKRGGKMLIWQGWADAIVIPQFTVDYYENVIQELGGLSSVQDFMRLFMLPGVDHCGILRGPGIIDTGFDPLTALEEWVEKGISPESLLTTQRDDEGNVTRTRPVCAYPKVAKYNGSGNINESRHFTCVLEKNQRRVQNRSHSRMKSDL